jgi:hypothetical protein
MKWMIGATMMAVFAGAALTTNGASARGIPITAHYCKVPHFTPSGLVYFTKGICR